MVTVLYIQLANTTKPNGYNTSSLQLLELTVTVLYT